MNRVDYARNKLEAEEAARRDFARRLGIYTDANTRVLCTCGLTMSREAFLEHQEQTHHEEKKPRTSRDMDSDRDQSEDFSKEARPLRHNS